MLPKNCVGEIYIAGDGVGKGYLYNDLLTNEKFIDNKFNPGTIMYSVGDLGKWNDNGTIECKGRMDHQIKLRGLRIELGEIEESIENFDKTNSTKVAVIVRKINNHDKLIAFVSSNKKTNMLDLKNFLMNKLPLYMIPNEFVFARIAENFPSVYLEK